jgi:hypothetical protein
MSRMSASALSCPQEVLIEIKGLGAPVVRPWPSPVGRTPFQHLCKVFLKPLLARPTGLNPLATLFPRSGAALAEVAAWQMRRPRGPL